jgi:ribosomal 30S subunit maturation factor RimM
MRVRILGDGPDNLLGQDEVALAEPERGAEDPAPRHFALEGGGTGRRGEVRLKLEGLACRDDAAAFEGWWVTVPAAALPALPEDEFYWYQLVGCEVAL